MRTRKCFVNGKDQRSPALDDQTPGLPDEFAVPVMFDHGTATGRRFLCCFLRQMGPRNFSTFILCISEKLDIQVRAVGSMTLSVATDLNR
jgi:hypothetical protein